MVFNLKGGGYGFLFRSEFVFSTTRELEYLFFLSRKAQIFFQEFNIRLYDKNSKSDFFFFLHQNQNIFFSNIGNQNIYIEKHVLDQHAKLGVYRASSLKQQSTDRHVAPL
jgi:hypothetical protein